MDPGFLTPGAPGGRRRRATRGVRDGASLLALAGFIIGVAVLTIAAGIHILSTGSQRAATGGEDDILFEFTTTRGRILDFVGSQPASVDQNRLAGRLRTYLHNDFTGTIARGYDVNVSLAAEGTLPKDESSFLSTGLGSCVGAPAEGCYDAITHDGVHLGDPDGNPATPDAVPYDCVSDGLVRIVAYASLVPCAVDEDLTTIAAIIHIEIRSPTASISEVVVVRLAG